MKKQQGNSIARATATPTVSLSQKRTAAVASANASGYPYILERIFYGEAEPYSVIVAVANDAVGRSLALESLETQPEAGKAYTAAQIAQALSEGGLYGPASKILLVPVREYVLRYDVAAPPEFSNRIPKPLDSNQLS